MKRTKYFNQTRPTETQLNFTETSRSEAILERFLALQQSGGGIESGLSVTTGSSNTAGDPRIKILPGSGFTPNGERILVSSAQDDIALSGTPSSPNYVLLVYTETEDTPLLKEDTSVNVNTLVHEDLAVTVEVLDQAGWDTLQTSPNLDTRLLVAIVADPGVNAVQPSDITNATNVGVFLQATQPVNITGVTIVSVTNDTPTGTDGFLQFTSDPTPANATLQWTAPGETTPGSAQLVGTNTTLTLPANGGSSIQVSLVLSSLPADPSTPSDTIAVSSIYDQTIPRLTTEDLRHRELVGSGVPATTNPHGLTASDLGISTSVEPHQDQWHAKGISLDAAKTFLGVTLNEGADTATFLRSLAATDVLLLNGKTRSFSSDLVASFTGSTAAGTYLLYSQSTDQLASGMVFGQAPAGTLVSGDPVSNWVGIRIVDIRTSGAGDGTLKFDLTAKTLSWKDVGSVTYGAVQPLRGGRSRLLADDPQFYIDVEVDEFELLSKLSQTSEVSIHTDLGNVWHEEIFKEENYFLALLDWGGTDQRFVNLTSPAFNGQATLDIVDRDLIAREIQNPLDSTIVAGYDLRIYGSSDAIWGDTFGLEHFNDQLRLGRHKNINPETCSLKPIITVGDGINSRGDFNGSDGIYEAVEALKVIQQGSANTELGATILVRKGSYRPSKTIVLSRQMRIKAEAGVTIFRDRLGDKSLFQSGLAGVFSGGAPLTGDVSGTTLTDTSGTIDFLSDVHKSDLVWIMTSTAAGLYRIESITSSSTVTLDASLPIVSMTYVVLHSNVGIEGFRFDGTGVTATTPVIDLTATHKAVVSDLFFESVSGSGAPLDFLLSLGGICKEIYCRSTSRTVRANTCTDLSIGIGLASGDASPSNAVELTTCTDCIIEFDELINFTQGVELLTTCQNIQIRGGTIALSGAGAVDAAIHSDNTGHVGVTISHVQILDAQKHGISLELVQGVSISNCFVSNATATGVLLASCTNVSLSALTVDSCNEGIRCNGGGTISIAGCSVRSSTADGCVINGVTKFGISGCSFVSSSSSSGLLVGPSCSDGTVAGCTFEGNAADGIQVLDSNRITVTGCTASINANGINVLSSASTCQNNTISGNTVVGNTSGGIVFSESGGGIVTKNVVAGNNYQGKGVDFGTTTGNYFLMNVGDDPLLMIGLDDNVGTFFPPVSAVTAVTTPFKSQVAFDLSDNQFKGYNGSSWVILG